MRPIARTAIAALAAASVVSAGCGDELAEFRDDELRPLERRADAQRAQLAATLEVVEAGSARHARVLESQLAALERTFAELAELDPPGDLDETYARFVAANEAFTERMHSFIDALRRGDGKSMKTTAESAKEAVGAAQRAIQPLHE